MGKLGNLPINEPLLHPHRLDVHEFADAAVEKTRGQAGIVPDFPGFSSCFQYAVEALIVPSLEDALNLAGGWIQADMRHPVLSFNDVKFYYSTYEISLYCRCCFRSGHAFRIQQHSLSKPRI
jgi:hypothetical protein